jgi:uncharacterized tellurite resistance protein B-like protein
MSFLRFLGNKPSDQTSTQMPAGQAALAAETDAIRRIVSRLEAMPPEQARLLAGIAYILARAANADLNISDVETTAMESELQAVGLDPSQAVLVVEMAKLQERTSGETSDYLATREFRERSTAEQRLGVLRACYRIARADDSIGSEEGATLNQIASELGFTREEASAIRAEHAEWISARFGFEPKP